VTRLRILADEDKEHAQHRIGQRLLDGYAVSIHPAAHTVLADVVAILATEDTAEEPNDYALAVSIRLSKFYGLGLVVGLGPGSDLSVPPRKPRVRTQG
jgi:hypothetical protein